MFDQTTTTSDDAPKEPPTALVTSGQATHKGLVRAGNEDDLTSVPDLGFYMVADGVGGAPAGAVASRLATVAMAYFLRNSGHGSPVADSATSVEKGVLETHGPRLVAAAHQAHKIIVDHAARTGTRGSATTMACLWLVGQKAIVANAGDSRVYRLCENGLQQLTKDHTAFQEYVDLFGPHPVGGGGALEHIVTQVLGGRSGRYPVVRLAEVPVEKGEVFLLCTDGLSKMVGDEAMARVIAASPSPQKAADALVALANEAGGLDNVTAIVVRVVPLDP